MLFYMALAGLAAAFIGTYMVNTYRSFRANLAEVKQSGLPYVCLPIYPLNRIWMVTHPLWLPLLHALPKAWTESWLAHCLPNFAWKSEYHAFKKAGLDVYIEVSPAKNTIRVADPEAISQIVARRTDFPKPTWIYRSLDLFGKNVVTTEGALWRQHRKITSPSFSEKNNHMVWQESLYQTERMMAGWAGEGTIMTGPLKDIATQAMRLSLHVISRAGFGVRLNWPHEETTMKIPEGHKLSFRDAMSSLLDNMIVILLTPRWILRNSPWKLQKDAAQAYSEWEKYMQEIYDEKLEQVEKGAAQEDGMDLMGTLIRAAGVASKPTSNGTEPEKAAQRSLQLLSKDEIIGNAFVFIVAGHETAANTVHFSTLFLAMHPDSQMRLQEDLDAILGDKPVSKWDYEEDLPKLFGSMCGAVMNEELRLIPPALSIPKSVSKNSPQALSIGGQSYTTPQGAYIFLEAAALHRNPKYWPNTSENDIREFRPERWLLDPEKTNTSTDAEVAPAGEKEDFDFDGPDTRPDTAATLFRPSKSAYIPFSEGYRSCLGRRFAQVEILAVLAVMFKTWTVELDVTEWLSDEDFETATLEQKREAWNKADARARHLLKHGMMTIITIQMRKEKVPMRFVKRGHERFKNLW